MMSVSTKLGRYELRTRYLAPHDPVKRLVEERVRGRPPPKVHPAQIGTLSPADLHNTKMRPHKNVPTNVKSPLATPKAA